MSIYRNLGVWIVLVLAGPAVVAAPEASARRAEKRAVTKYVRFRAGEVVAYGILDGQRVRRLSGDLFAKWLPTDKVYALSEVKLLVPTRPTKILALAGNYRTHLGDTPVPGNPEVFFKVPSALLPPGGDIVLPRGSREVHYEAEMVLVIGKRAKNVPVERALDYVLGVTCGNDVSARDWQQNDRQWWRAKSTDTFAPCGPCIAAGLDYDDLELELRLNGEVRQQQRTRDMIHHTAEIVSWISRHVTLEPGDLIYTGTPGKTSALKPGDVVEVRLEGVGTLRNGVVAEN